ncbi:MAG: cell division protein FtsZ [Chitinophagales bacterium]
MAIHFNLPEDKGSEIKVIGVGGGGSNAVSYMYSQGIVGVNFIICNTDAQALQTSTVPEKIQLGPQLTQGRGAGSLPEVGRKSTIESLEDIKKMLANGTQMVFVTAGMGGGTGTGGAPEVARIARELGILTVGIVTMPFGWEGARRQQQAEKGLDEMSKNVDALIVISNDKICENHPNLSFTEAFNKANEVLAVAAKGIAEIITITGIINVDFEDVKTVMRDSGVAIMGNGIGEGENRAIDAVNDALDSPLIMDNDIAGAKHVLLNIISGKEKTATMEEVMEISSFVQEKAQNNADIIFGTCIDEELGDKICVIIIATGFKPNATAKKIEKERITPNIGENKPPETNSGNISVPPAEFSITNKANDDYKEPKPAEKKVVQEPNPKLVETSPKISEEKSTPKVNEKENLPFNPINNQGNKVNKTVESEKKSVAPPPPPVKLEQEEGDFPVRKHLEELKRKMREKFKNSSDFQFDEKQIGKLEGTPAYMRKKNIDIEPENLDDKSLSRYRITNDDDELLDKENRHLHDQVD